MGLFNRPAKLGAKLATRTTLLLRADPGDALLDAARRYDLQVRRVRDRLVFQNGVLLIGPVTMTPEIERRARMAAGMADRLGGTVQYSSPQAKLALIASMYSERDLPTDRVTECSGRAPEP